MSPCNCPVTIIYLFLFVMGPMLRKLIPCNSQEINIDLPTRGNIDPISIHLGFLGHLEVREHDAISVGKNLSQ